MRRSGWGGYRHGIPASASPGTCSLGHARKRDGRGSIFCPTCRRLARPRLAAPTRRERVAALRDRTFSVVDPVEVVRLAREMSGRAVARRLGVSVATVQDALRASRLEGRGL